MSNRTLFLSEDLYAYMKQVSLREPPILSRLREETLRDPMHGMQISPEQGQFMGLLVKLMDAGRALEIGVYTGYSSLCVAMALQKEGKLVACDVSAEWTSIARRYWEEAGLSSRVELHLGPAMETLEKMIARRHSGTFDFAFIDADKENYDGYYEGCLRLLRKGGVMVIDNVFWDGRVIDSQAPDESTRAIQALNAKIHRDERVDLSILPVGDGLTLVRKR